MLEDVQRATLAHHPSELTCRPGWVRNRAQYQGHQEVT